QDNAKVLVRRGVVRPEADCFPNRRDRLVQTWIAPEHLVKTWIAPEHIAKVEVRRGVVRLEADCFAEGRDRLLGTSTAVEGNADVKMGPRTAGAERSRHGVIPRRLAPLFPPAEEVSESLIDPEVARLPLQRLTEQG